MALLYRYLAATPCVAALLGGVPTVDQDGLPGHPPAVSDKEAAPRHDVGDVGQASAGECRQRRRGLVVRLRIGTLGRVEERRIHRTGTDRGHRDAALAEFLRRCAAAT
ncbi:hypothetical protein G6F24_017063 [Rhizopus arrhizus]|nr:hypothetical protein G6F24_017063 [Rhizopus arrhizus]